jgi:hypothetical protein
MNLSADKGRLCPLPISFEYHIMSLRDYTKWLGSRCYKHFDPIGSLKLAHI